MKLPHRCFDFPRRTTYLFTFRLSKLIPLLPVDDSLSTAASHTSLMHLYVAGPLCNNFEPPILIVDHLFGAELILPPLRVLIQPFLCLSLLSTHCPHCRSATHSLREASSHSMRVCASNVPSPSLNAMITNQFPLPKHPTLSKQRIRSSHSHFTELYSTVTPISPTDFVSDRI